MTWTLLGMLSNTWNQNEPTQFGYSFSANKIIAMNHSLVQQIQISIENYIVSLCDLNSIYEKVNMEYLGISKAEFDTVMEEIVTGKEKVIEICRWISVNTDVAMELIEYCSSKRAIKEEGIKSELARSQMAVDIFFKNASDFAKEYFGEKLDGVESLKLAYNKDKEIIEISRTYALLVEAALQEREPNVLMSRDEKKREEMVEVFAAKLMYRVEKVPELERVSKYFVTKTAKNAEVNMSNLASNIQRYYSLHRDENMNKDDFVALRDLYRKIMDIYWENPQNEISDEVNNQYKKLRNKYDKVCQ